MIELGNEWCTEEKHGIHKHRHTYIKRKYRVVVACGRFVEIDESLRKTGTLQVASNSREDGEYGHYAIVALGQMTSKDDTYYEVQYLGSSAVERSPEQAFRRFLL